MVIHIVAPQLTFILSNQIERHLENLDVNFKESSYTRAKGFIVDSVHCKFNYWVYGVQFIKIIWSLCFDKNIKNISSKNLLKYLRGISPLCPIMS